jgi:hypothetical protein
MQGSEAALLSGRRDQIDEMGGIMPRSFDMIFSMIAQRQEK